MTYYLNELGHLYQEYEGHYYSTTTAADLTYEIAPRNLVLIKEEYFANLLTLPQEPTQYRAIVRLPSGGLIQRMSHNESCWFHPGSKRGYSWKWLQAHYVENVPI